jgi:hypothetical protein
MKPWQFNYLGVIGTEDPRNGNGNSAAEGAVWPESTAVRAKGGGC